MQPTDFQRFHAVMQGMAKLYDKDLDRVLLDVYWLSLKGWELPAFEQAAAHLMANSKFMPRPADFTELRKAGRPTAGEAWGIVLKYVRGGWYRWQGGGVGSDPRVPEPPDAHIANAVEAIGGYRAIAMTNEDQLHFLERRFCDHFSAMRDANEIRQAIPDVIAPRVSGPQPIARLTKDMDS